MHAIDSTSSHLTQSSEPSTPYGIPLAQLLSKEDEPLRWLVEGLFPWGGLFILSGQPKRASKSLFLMSMSLAVAAGEDFMGMPTTLTPVAYAFLEDGERRARRRFRQLGASRLGAIPFNALFSAMHLEATMDRLQRERRAALLIIDSLPNYQVIKGLRDENSAIEVERMLRPLRDFVHATGSTVIGVNHFRKRGDTARGSTAFRGSVDGWAEVFEDADHHRIEVTLRDAEDATLRVEWTIDGDQLRVSMADRSSSLVAGKPSYSQDARLLELIRSLPAPVTESGLIEASGLRRGVVRTSLSRLVRHHEVEKTGHNFAPASKLTDPNRNDSATGGRAS